MKPAALRRWFATTVLLASAAASVLAQPGATEIGEAVYRRGEIAPGQPVAARSGAGGWHLKGSVVACANCHGSQREGGREGAVLAPSLRWVDDSPAARQQLRAALMQGIGRDGRRLDPTMPRFEFDDAAVVALQQHLASANEPGHQGATLPLYLTLMPEPALRLAHESALLDGLQRCFAPLAGSAAPVLRWQVLVHASPAEAVAHWREAVGNPQLAAIVAPSLRGWKAEWLQAVRAAGPATARWPSIVFPLIDDPIDADLDAGVPVHWLFGGSRERESVLRQTWQRHAAAAAASSASTDVPPHWTAVPARTGAGGPAGVSFGALWADAACTTLQAAQQRSLSAPSGLAHEPAQPIAWALQRMGRLETAQGLALEPGHRIAVDDWAVWERLPGAAPRLIEPRATLRRASD